MVRTIVAGAVALLMVPVAATAQEPGAPPVMSVPPRDLEPLPMMMPQRGPDFAPPMRAGYQRLAYGMTLPREWVAPSHLIGDVGRYGLPVPAAGFGWSRYHDDAVLTDRYGRVYDARYDFERVRPDGMGHRFEGRFDGEVSRDGHRPRRERGRTYSYDGRWTGSWDGGPVRTYEGRFDGDVRPHWDMGYIEGRGPSYGHGYVPVSYAADCGCGETVTTVTTTTSPSTTRTVRYGSVREAAPRRVRAAPRGKYVRLR